MSTEPLAEPKWTLPESTTLSRLTREAMFKAIAANRQRLGAGRSWTELVNDPTTPLFSKEDGERVAREVFEQFQRIEGRKFYASCEVAVAERPDLYVLRSGVEPASSSQDWPEGVLGDGDNGFQIDHDVEGEILVVREVSQVDKLMRSGVPEGTIAVIDDAGGTMTAPILEEFDGVLCLAGSVRSHLAIIAREMGVPVLMGVRLSRPLENGERVVVGFTTEGQNVDAYAGDEKPRAEIRLAGVAR
jgi:phosphohistidine swiveling domain-containing protein